MRQAAKQSATLARLQLLVLAIVTVSTTSCSCGRKTALGAHARDAQADIAADVARGDGSAWETGTDAPLFAGTGGAAVGGNSGAPTGGHSGAVNGGGGSAGNANGGAAGRIAAGGSAGTVTAGGVAGAAAGGTGGIGGLLATGGRTDISVGGGGGRSANGGSAGQAATGGVADAGAGGAGGKTTGLGDDGAVADGPPHWRESSGRLCTGAGYPTRVASVWSDDRGVFVLVPDGDNPASIWANSGTGWRSYFSWPKGKWYFTGGIRGIVDGPLFAFGQSSCGIQLIDDVGAHCSGAAAAVALSVVGANLAYAANFNILLKYDGELWTQLGEPLLFDAAFVNAKGIWADASTIVVTGSNGLVVTIKDEKTPVLLPEPTGANILATWAFGANDIWIGTEGRELYHYDGSQWSLKASLPSGRDMTFVRLWGKDGHLFVVSNQLFAEWDGSQLRNLLPAEAGPISFTDVWGNSPTEVFATGVGFDAQTGGCSAFQVWWYDGAVARPM